MDSHISLYYTLQLAQRYKDDQNASYFNVCIRSIAHINNLKLEYALYITAIFLYPELADNQVWPRTSPFLEVSNDKTKEQLSILR